MPVPLPYLSVVATSRNDDHGGNLLGRMQAFVNGLVEQCRRHDLAAELILVEWNPPADSLRLAEALRWPEDTGPCQIRIIEVPERLHRRFKHARSLPLFQMIAKNAGIRRARGEFILATNIDILFSDELMAFLAARKLEPRRMYRIDRHDVMADLPIEAALDERLAWCRSHLLRVNRREGTFSLTPVGTWSVEPQDIVAAESGLQLGAGWYGLEKENGEPYRWVSNAAEVEVRMPAERCSLYFELEPGPGVSHRPFELELRDWAGRLVAQGVVEGPQQVRLRLPLKPGESGRFTLHVSHGGRPTANDWRTLNFRVFQCGWAPPLDDEEVPDSDLFGTFNFKSEPARRWHAGELWHEDIAAEDLGLRFGRGWHVVERWHGSLFRWAGNDAELFLKTADLPPEAMTFEIEPGPGVDYRPFDLQVFNERGELLTSCPVDGRQPIVLRLPLAGNQVHRFRFHVDGGGLPAPGDSRILNYRVFQPIRAGAASYRLSRRRVLKQAAALLPTPVARTIKRTVLGAGELAVLPEPAARKDEVISPLPLHLNACGDFTLMAREHWFRLRGYPEWEIFSLHLDSVLCYMAHHAGARETVLRDPLRIYHLEHASGSGWTPEGAETLERKVRERGIPILNVGQVLRWGTQMRRADKPISVNGLNWGLADHELVELSPQARRRVFEPAGSL